MAKGGAAGGAGGPAAGAGRGGAAARARVAAAGCGLLAACTLAGCVSTQQRNERAKLRATRELASRVPQRVTQPNPHVRVTDVALVRGGRRAAVVVELRSSAREPLTDVPVAVGVRTPGGRRVRLNARRDLGWFQTHVPAIAAGGTVTWVYSARARAVPAGRPFAVVGAADAPAISDADALPQIDAAALADVGGDGARGSGGGRRGGGAHGSGARGDGSADATVRAVVENRSDVPQDEAQVYALVRDGDRWVAAGKASIAHLGGNARATARIPLAGSARGRAVRVHAIPTIFR